jgi:putative holliday junction resolvase
MFNRWLILVIVAFSVIISHTKAFLISWKFPTSFIPPEARYHTKADVFTYITPTFLSSSDIRFSDDINQNKDLLDAMAHMTSSSSSLLGRKSLGVDFGLVRTGLAVSVGYEPKPLNTVSDLNNTQLCQHIIKLVEAEEAKQIIVGLPFHKNGTEAEQTIITRQFASTLICATYAHFGPDKIPIYLWDERYTSKEAAARKRAANPRANLFKELDADAACIILEYYYQDDGKGAIKVELPDDENIRNAVEQAWLMKVEEDKQRREQLRESRMNASNSRQAMMERARLLDERLAKEYGRNNVSEKTNKKKKRKKK